MGAHRCSMLFPGRRCGSIVGGGTIGKEEKIACPLVAKTVRATGERKGSKRNTRSGLAHKADRPLVGTHEVSMIDCVECEV